MLNDTANYYIIAGDFNAKHTDWANEKNNERGITLKKWIDDNDMKYKLKLYRPNMPSFPRVGLY